MNPLDILRRVTTPMTDRQSAEFVRTHYGVFRENASSDDLVSVEQAQHLIGRSVDLRAEPTLESKEIV